MYIVYLYRTNCEPVVVKSSLKEDSIYPSVPTTTSHAVKGTLKMKKVRNVESATGFGKIRKMIIDWFLNIGGFEYKIYEGKFLTTEEVSRIYNELNKESR